MIVAETNIYTVFITCIMSLIKENNHPLVKKYLKSIPENLKKQVIFEYKNFPPLQIYYQYITLTPYINNNFNIEIDLDTLNKTYKNHVNLFNSLLKKTFLETNFQSFYKNNIENEYENEKKNILEIFTDNSKVYNELIKFWEPANEPKLIVIPNFLASGDCFGIRKKQDYYAIISPKKNPINNLTEYYKLHVLKICIHEFSHSFFKDIITMDSDILQEKLNKLDIPKHIKTIYNTAYFEESFVRASTLHISSQSNIYQLKKKELKEKIDTLIEMEIENGYIFTKELYNEFENPIQKQKIFNNFLQKI